MTSCRKPGCASIRCGIPTGRGQRVLPWLYAIARNIRVDVYRKTRRTELREQSFEDHPDIPQMPQVASQGTPGLEAFFRCYRKANAR